MIFPSSAAHLALLCDYCKNFGENEEKSSYYSITLTKWPHYFEPKMCIVSAVG